MAGSMRTAKDTGGWGFESGQSDDLEDHENSPYFGNRWNETTNEWGYVDERTRDGDATDLDTDPDASTGDAPDAMRRLSFNLERLPPDLSASRVAGGRRPVRSDKIAAGFPDGKLPAWLVRAEKGGECTVCDRVLTTEGALAQHLRSAAHQAKLTQPVRRYYGAVCMCACPGLEQGGR
jgi:hypothetical protein